MRTACILVAAIGAAVVAACSGDADQESLTGSRHNTVVAPGAGDGEGTQASPSSTTSNDPGGTSGDTTTDASASNVNATPKDGGADAAKNDCIDGVASPGSGKHHAGEDCLGCHDTQSKHWTVAGTLYSAATGGTAVAGATIEVVDATGKVVKLTTYTNGNFYTTTAVTKPLKVRATKCPTSLPMAGAVTDGSCNGCHNSSMRVHL
jgi:hypothetical protein